MRTSRMSRSSIVVPCFAAASSRSVWVNVSPLSSQSLPRWRAMSISTPRPTTPRSAIGRIEAQLMPPPLVVSAERPFQSVSSYQAWPSASYCDEPCRKISALSSVARMPPGKLGPSARLEELLVPHHLALDALAAREDGVAVRVAHRALEREDLAVAHARHAPEHLGGVEVVQRADLVVGTPFPPVLRGVVAQQFPHRRDVGHVSSPLRERGHHAGDPAHRAPSPDAATRGQHIGRRDRRGAGRVPRP